MLRPLIYTHPPDMSSLDRWGVYYIWEKPINDILAKYNLALDGVICIRNIPSIYPSYMAYLNVKPLLILNTTTLFVQFYVQLKEGSCFINPMPTFRTAMDLDRLNSLDRRDIIFDRRDEFFTRFVPNHVVV